MHTSNPAIDEYSSTDNDSFAYRQFTCFTNTMCTVPWHRPTAINGCAPHDDKAHTGMGTSPILFTAPPLPSISSILSSSVALLPPSMASWSCSVLEKVENFRVPSSFPRSAVQARIEASSPVGQQFLARLVFSCSGDPCARELLSCKGDVQYSTCVGTVFFFRSSL